MNRCRIPLARLSSLRACQRQGKLRPVLRPEAGRLARAWLAELEYWRAAGEQVPERLMAEARGRAG